MYEDDDDVDESRAVVRVDRDTKDNVLSPRELAALPNKNWEYYKV